MIFKTVDEVDQEQLIGTVDVWGLRHYRWPILRTLARAFVEDLELGHHLRALLATGRWTVLRVTPHVDADGQPSTHVFDIHGRARVPAD